MKRDYNFFERRKRKKVLADIHNYDFRSIPAIFRHDPEIIEGILLHKPYVITQLEWKEAEPIIEKNPDYLNHFDTDFRLDLALRDSKYVDFLKQEELLTLIKSHYKREYINRLPKETQRELLEENFVSYYDNLQLFNFDVVLDSIKDNLIKRKTDYRAEHSFVNFFRKIDMSIFTPEQQMSIIVVDPSFLDKVSEETLKLFINDNPYLIKMLPDNLRETYRNMDEFSYRNASNLLYRDGDLNGYGKENAKRYLAHALHNFNLTLIANRENITDWADLARFDHRVFTVNRSSNDIRSVKKIFALGDFYKKELEKYPGTYELQEYFDAKNGDQYLFRIGYRENDFTEKFNQISKIILNEKIMSSCNKETLLEFIKNPLDNEMLREIVETAYGKEASNVLSDRPEITIAEIPTFDIFDEKSFNHFGKGVIHNVLSYNSKTGNIIGELVRNEDKLQGFLRFKELTKRYYKNTALDNYEQLRDFLDINQLFKGKIDLFSLNEVEANNLTLFIIDRFGSSSPNEFVKVESLEELRDYHNRRSLLLDEAMSKTTDLVQAKNFLFLKHFGMYYSLPGEIFRPQKSDAIKMLNKYNIKSFLEDERTTSSDVFTVEELEMLKIAQIISSIGSVDIIKDMYNVLGNKEDILTPLDFKEIKAKVPGIYSQELVDSLLKKEDMDKMVSEGVMGISKQIEEDVEVYTLDGVDFRIFLHTTGLNNSNITINNPNPFIRINLLDKWNTFEHGVSTISGSVIEPAMLYSCATSENINLGFSDFDPNVVLGMGFGDIHVAHDGRLLDVYFNERGPTYRFDYPEELVRKTAAQIHNVLGIPKDESHEYNEVAISRREVNPDNIRDNTYGGRIQPDYIVLYGTENYQLETAKKLSKNLEKDGKNIPIIKIDVNKYREIGNSYRRAFEGHNTEQTLAPETPFVESIRERTGIVR